jgi:para-aminobenzoate synthetase component 1
VTDHTAQTTDLWHDAECSAAYLRSIAKRLAGCTAPDPEFSIGRFASSMTDRDYFDAFAAIKDYLASGECYQVNLARHYAASLTGDRSQASWSTYRRLVELQPAPFGAYLSTPFGEMVCLSPERFIRHNGSRIVTSPIKGTAPRHRDIGRDHASHERLRRSAKDRAENLMIVDLLRNDLGRICRPGSINVDELFRIESFANVHHMVSTIRGETRPGVDAWEVLTATFPGGSITGAPKIRAMQIINELEPVARAIYCGSIGYVDRSGTLDTNIAIRTLAFTPSGVHGWGGGGIVADSIATTEMAEIEHKIGRLLQSTAGFSASSSCNAS